MTDWQLYFGEGRNPITALYVWRGGLGIWGAIALGIVGVWIGARLRGLKLLPLLDALAPGVLVAQALGRWGNWFNQELYGRPTDLPWGLEIDPALGDGVRSQFGPDVLFHPTFLYECLWNLAAFALIIWLDRRFRLGHGRVAALYIMLYTLGRGWIENLRIDDVQMDDVMGLRLNVWTSIVLFVLAAAWFIWSAVRHPGREDVVRTREPDVEPVEAPDARPSETRPDASSDAPSDAPGTHGAHEATHPDGPDRVEPTQDGRPAGPTA
jgi:prolipoprotein diacylglyceryl transferase